jgi:hypothetical protein
LSPRELTVTINEILRDLNIRHQIQLHRLASGTAAQVNELLAAVEDDLVAQIAKYDPTADGGYSKARLSASASVLSLRWPGGGGGRLCGAPMWIGAGGDLGRIAGAARV